MNKGLRKFIIFAITIVSISIVVFNNISQLVQELFIPQLNLRLWLAFGLAVIGVITYAVVNKEMLKW